MNVIWFELFHIYFTWFERLVSPRAVVVHTILDSFLWRYEHFSFFKLILINCPIALATVVFPSKLIVDLTSAFLKTVCFVLLVHLHFPLWRAFSETPLFICYTAHKDVYYCEGGLSSIGWTPELSFLLGISFECVGYRQWRHTIWSLSHKCTLIVWNVIGHSTSEFQTCSLSK